MRYHGEKKKKKKNRRKRNSSEQHVGFSRGRERSRTFFGAGFLVLRLIGTLVYRRLVSNVVELSCTRNVQMPPGGHSAVF